jgi:acyl carrier protein
MTGGVGRIGLVFAEFLARRGARTLILTSRDGSLRQEDIRWTRIRAIEALGTRVFILGLADAGDPDQVRDVVAQARSVAGRIRGVFHAAGVTTESAFQPFAQIDRTISEAHFQAKHRAALALSSAFADDPPDFFFMLSSISTALGGLGFGAYASANCLLDAVARRAPGPSRWMTVNWDGWSLGPRSVGQKGSLIFAEEGVEALHRILAATDMRHVIVSVRPFGPRLQKVIDPPRADHSVVSQVSCVYDRPAISTDFVQPVPGLQDAIATIWGNLLGVAHVGANDNFFELGGDSLLATQVVSRVKQNFQVEVPVRQLFEAPTVRQWAACVTQALHAGSESEPVLRRSAHGGTAPVSFSQQRLWFLAQLVPDSPFYNIPEAVRLRGCLRRKALARAIQEIVRRHEALRTTFVEMDGQPMQTIGVAHIAVPLVDVSHLRGNQQEAEVDRLVGQAVHACFDLARGPLLRVTLLQLAPQEHVCVVVTHHIISDSWSMKLFMNELVAEYTATVRETPSRLAEVPVQYADFATWQRQWLTGTVLERHMAYWTRRLAPPLSPLELPLDYPRPEVFSYRGARQAIVVERNLTQALRRLSQTEGVTIFMAVLAAFLVLLQRYTQRDDLIVGTPIAGRDRREIEEVIGNFVNLLVLRTDVGGNPPFCDLLRRVRTVTLEAYENQQIPFEKLIDHLKLKRDVGSNPLVQVVLDVKMGTVGSAECAGVVVSPYDFSIAYTKFDLALVLNEVDQGLRGYIEYSTDLFGNATIVKMVNHFITLLESIVENPAERIMVLSLLNEQEKAEIMEHIYKERRNLSAEFSF